MPQRPRQRASDGYESSRLAQRVTDASHRLDQAWLAARLGLASQIADVDVKRVRREPEVVAPDPFEDQRPRQHLARIEHEELEQRELGPSQLDQLPVALDLARRRIELDISEAKRLARAVRRPPQQSS